MSLRSGITTGTCAAAAAKAATIVLAGGGFAQTVEVQLPSGQLVRIAVLSARLSDDATAATAAVRKDAGDDPDVTHGLEIRATVSWIPGSEIVFVAGDGVGTVTRPGLQVPPGQPAINPVPRQMIAAAIREITARGVRVEIAIPGGREIAARTFNPRLGIEGGLSILGTTGIVRPYCTKALRDALRCGLDVAVACGVRAAVLVPGNIGAKAAGQHFSLRDEQLIEVGNEWGYVLDLAAGAPLEALLLVGHPGKLAKLADGQWDTHSARSGRATDFLGRLSAQLFGEPPPESPTVEGIFANLAPAQRQMLGNELARQVRAAVARRLQERQAVAVFLVNMAGQCLGIDGELSPWLPRCATASQKQCRQDTSENTACEQAVAHEVTSVALAPHPQPLSREGERGDNTRIAIVGCGPGSAEYVTDAARQAVARADVLVGSPRLLELFAVAAGQQVAVDAGIATALEKMAELRQAGRTIAVLVSGDPGLYSIAARVIARFGRENCNVTAAVSSVQVAFARLGLDWSDARVVSAHGRTPPITADELARSDKLAVLAGTPEAIQWSARAAEALRASHDVFLCENLTLAGERIRPLTPEQLAAADAASLAIVVFLRRSLGT